MNRNLSLTALVSVIFFNVCAGPYALEPVLNAGPGLALLLILATPLFWAMPVATVCAELGTALPEEGGYYAWSKRALGPFAAFCQGWWAWLFTLVDLGIYPAMFCDYLANFVPEMDDKTGNFWLRKGVMVAVIWIFIGLNLRGARTVGGFTKLFAVLVLSPFVLMAVFGLYYAVRHGGFPQSPVQPFLHPRATLSMALAASLPIALWNFQGWDAISTVAGEMNDPRRDYPRALGIAAVIITATYAVPAFFGMAFVSPTEMTWETGSWSVAAERIAGPWLANWVSAMGMASALGLFASLVLCYSRIPFVMAFDGYLPKSLTLCNANGAPTVALLVCGVLYTIVVLTFRNFEELAEVDVTMFTAVMAMELLSFFVLRIREPNLPRPFRIPGGWLVAAVICALPLGCAAISMYSCVTETENGLWRVVGKALLLMATGPLLYPLLAWRRRRVASADTANSPDAVD